MKNIRGISATEILLPNKDVDMSKWSVIACDQFTSEEKYWLSLKEYIGNEKSTLNLILPEIYLKNEYESRIESINTKMLEYQKENVFKILKKGFILTVRSTPYVKKRIGLIGAVDLEEYEYSKKSSALIRSTEGTIEDRIPPRLKIRQNASLELTHIMLLYDDIYKSINEKLYDNRMSYDKVYDFDLNMEGGHIEGYYIKDYQEILDKFMNLITEDKMLEKYGNKTPFLFAVGDGNHSLATAKTHWNRVKQNLTEEEQKTHPARFALVEIVNLYDEGIYFEPIHRFIELKDKNEFLKGLESIKSNYKVYDGNDFITVKNGLSLPESIKNIDDYIAEFIKNNGGKVDYIHGDKNVTDLVDGNKNSIAILFDKMEKTELFKYVSKYGSLPRKTFSMGEGKEKRYYLEAKKIVK